MHPSPSPELALELSKIGIESDDIKIWWSQYDTLKEEEKIKSAEKRQLKLLLQLQELGKNEPRWCEKMMAMQEGYCLFDYETWLQHGNSPYDELQINKDENFRNKFRQIISEAQAS